MNPLTHRRMHSWLGPYLDGELRGARAESIRAHLRECWWCSGEAETHRLVRASLRARAGRTPALPVRRLQRFVRRLDQPSQS